MSAGFAEDFKEGVLSFYLQYATGNLKKELETKAGQNQCNLSEV